MTHEETETERLAKALRAHRAALDRHRDEMRDLRTLLDVTQKRYDLRAKRMDRDDPYDEITDPPSRCSCEDREWLLWCTCGGAK